MVKALFNGITAYRDLQPGYVVTNYVSVDVLSSGNVNLRSLVTACLCFLANIH